MSFPGVQDESVNLESVSGVELLESDDGYTEMAHTQGCIWRSGIAGALRWICRIGPHACHQSTEWNCRNPVTDVRNWSKRMATLGGVELLESC